MGKFEIIREQRVTIEAGSEEQALSEAANLEDSAWSYSDMYTVTFPADWEADEEIEQEPTE